MCTNATAPSVSSINRILRNRAAERAAAEFARAAGYGLYPPHPYAAAAAFPWHSPLWPNGKNGKPGLTGLATCKYNLQVHWDCNHLVEATRR